MDITNVVSQGVRVEPAREAPAAGRWRPQDSSGEPSGVPAEPEAALSASDARQAGEDLASAAREISIRFDLKTEVVWDAKSGGQIVKVMSPDGNRLVCQFPSEVVLRLAERLRHGANQGLLASLV